MNEGSSNSAPKGQPEGFDGDCIPIVLDGPEDTTVRPPRPEYVKSVTERRERYARLMELWNQQQEREKAKGTTNETGQG
jgi:hypothetical protein